MIKRVGVSYREKGNWLNLSLVDIPTEKGAVINMTSEPSVYGMFPLVLGEDKIVGAICVYTEEAKRYLTEKIPGLPWEGIEEIVKNRKDTMELLEMLTDANQKG